MTESKSGGFSKRKSFLAIGLILLGMIVLFGKEGNSYPTGETFVDQTLKNEPIIMEGFPSEEVVEAQVPQKILIPDLAIDLEVKKAEMVDGYWQVFETYAAWGEGSGVPGKNGNVVIFAHARRGLFLPLRKVTQGMKIYVLNSKEWFNYEVKEIKEVTPDVTEVVGPTEDETLTLYTCSGFDDAKRLIVVAKKI